MKNQSTRRWAFFFFSISNLGINRIHKKNLCTSKNGDASSQYITREFWPTLTNMLLTCVLIQCISKKVFREQTDHFLEADASPSSPSIMSVCTSMSSPKLEPASSNFPNDLSGIWQRSQTCLSVKISYTFSPHYRGRTVYASRKSSSAEFSAGNARPPPGLRQSYYIR